MPDVLHGRGGRGDSSLLAAIVLEAALHLLLLGWKEAPLVQEGEGGKGSLQGDSCRQVCVALQTVVHLLIG